MWAKLACLTQLYSISGVYCHADTIPVTHALSPMLAQAHGYAYMHIYTCSGSRFHLGLLFISVERKIPIALLVRQIHVWQTLFPQLEVMSYHA